jgi:hypothetical protein
MIVFIADILVCTIVYGGQITGHGIHKSAGAGAGTRDMVESAGRCIYQLTMLKF